MSKIPVSYMAITVSVMLGIAQDQSSTPQMVAESANPIFEVAAVKAVQSPLDAGGRRRCPESFKIDRSRLDIECANLTRLIAYAFHISPERVAGPDWMAGSDSPRFQVVARLPQGASENQVPGMLQRLLSDRFNLQVHHGMREQRIYALIVAKGGLKVKEAAVEAATPVADQDVPHIATDVFGNVETRTTQTADGDGYTTTISNAAMGTVRQTGSPEQIQRWEAPRTTFEGVADLLDKVAPLSSPVIDMTGVTGRYQIALEVSLRDAIGAPRAAGDDPRARENALMDLDEYVLKAFNDGLRNLGLRLEPRKAFVEVLAVDHVEKMPTGN